MNNFDRWLDIAEKAARRAGSFLATAGENSRAIRSEVRRDIKISADILSEGIITKFLRNKTDFPILSEETGLFGKITPGGPIWIVDPLDGSMNFLRGIPISCVSVALWKNDKPLLGVVYDFNKNELYSGIAGKISWLNQERIKVSAIGERKKAVLCTGFPANTDFSSEGLSRFVNQIRLYRKVRLIGSAALSLAYVAAGKVDAYYEDNIMLWDIAAGIAIVTGAKGKVQIRPLLKDNSFFVRASNSHLSLQHLGPPRTR